VKEASINTNHKRTYKRFSRVFRERKEFGAKNEFTNIRVGTTTPEYKSKFWQRTKREEHQLEEARVLVKGMQIPCGLDT